MFSLYFFSCGAPERKLLHEQVSRRRQEMARIPANILQRVFTSLSRRVMLFVTPSSVVYDE
jgi:hypothetical protein